MVDILANSHPPISLDARLKDDEEHSLINMMRDENQDSPVLDALDERE